MTTAKPWSMVPNGEDSQGNPLYDLVSEGADLIIARSLWREDAEAILKAMSIPTLEEALPMVSDRGFRYVEIPFRDYEGDPQRTFSIQESSLATERRLWVGIGDRQGRGHLSEDVVRKIRDALSAWLAAGQEPETTPDAPAWSKAKVGEHSLGKHGDYDADCAACWVVRYATVPTRSSAQ